jgi:hypothetical protein
VSTMETIERELLEHQVDDVRANTVSSSSRTIYMNSATKFIEWLVANNTSLLTDEFLSQIAHAHNVVAFTRQWLSGAPSNPPIRFAQLTAREFFVWIVSLKKSDGTRPGYSTYNTHRAALFNLFRDYQVTMTKALEVELKNHFKGLKRKAVIEISNGNGKIKVGKDAMQFSLYQVLGKELLKHHTNDFVFGHTFMVLCWNLMCRAGNVVSVCYSHLEWREDALCIYFAHMKNDQLGDRPRDPRHIYANPVLPHVCPVLSLGIYMMCFPPTTTRIFPGNDQYDRYRRVLARLLLLENTKNELVSRGMDATDIGTHSTRKGAATYCSSGTTACPSSAAIHLRAGWAMGGVQDTYLRYESAGDMHVGRTVCGLPTNSTDFAILPPFFIERGVLLESSITACFPGLPQNARRIGEFTLASVVYHTPYLKNTLPKRHPVFTTRLFCEPNLLAQLSRLVVCRMSRPDDPIQPTGVPPHISLLNQMMNMTEEMKAIIPAVDRIVPRVVNGVETVLEERAIGAGTVTRDGLEVLLKKSLQDTGIFEIVDHLRERSTPTTSVESIRTPEPQYTVHLWNGKFHQVPIDYDLPNCGVLQAWQHWCLGDSQRKIAPLRRLKPYDIYNDNTRKRLSDFRLVMKHIEESVNWPTESSQIPTLEEVNDTFHLASLNWRLDTQRLTQIKWRTAANILRKSAPK